MNINEISKQEKQKIDKIKTVSYYQVSDKLEKLGFREIDSGAYSSVYAKKNSKYVIKLSRNEDLCYLTFVEWVLKQKNNPYLPKIFMLKTYRDQNGKKMVITAIEKLRRFKIDSFSDDIVSINLWKKRHLPMLAFLSLNMKENTRYLFRNEFIKTYDSHFKITYDFDYTPIIKEYSKRFEPSLMAKTINKIKTQLMGACEYDLHQGNIMYRPGKNELVIIDPLANWSIGNVDYPISKPKFLTGLIK